MGLEAPVSRSSCMYCFYLVGEHRHCELSLNKPVIRSGCMYCSYLFGEFRHFELEFEQMCYKGQLACTVSVYLMNVSTAGLMNKLFIEISLHVLFGLVHKVMGSMIWCAVMIVHSGSKTWV